MKGWREGRKAAEGRQAGRRWKRLRKERRKTIRKREAEETEETLYVKKEKIG